MSGGKSTKITEELLAGTEGTVIQLQVPQSKIEITAEMKGMERNYLWNNVCQVRQSRDKKDNRRGGGGKGEG